MSDYEFPADLLELQRAYWAADARVLEVTEALPPSPAIVAGEAEISEEQRAELAEAREQRLRALEAMNNHAWWATVPTRYAAWMALQKAAKA
ncbi:hypothetical protein AB0395_25145 [Streptosporangium sp. NPDC051023]|uniref:hypothetical protein n=1 Tax=Streptosporangium sp. NPDC051023 TaxID=3155410 RepID=UPI00344C8E7E